MTTNLKTKWSTTVRQLINKGVVYQNRDTISASFYLSNSGVDCALSLTLTPVLLTFLQESLDDYKDDNNQYSQEVDNDVVDDDDNDFIINDKETGKNSFFKKSVDDVIDLLSDDEDDDKDENECIPTCENSTSYQIQDVFVDEIKTFSYSSADYTTSTNRNMREGGETKRVRSSLSPQSLSMMPLKERLRLLRAGKITSLGLNNDNNSCDSNSVKGSSSCDDYNGSFSPSSRSNNVENIENNINGVDMSPRSSPLDFSDDRIDNLLNSPQSKHVTMEEQDDEVIILDDDDEGVNVTHTLSTTYQKHEIIKENTSWTSSNISQKSQKVTSTTNTLLTMMKRQNSITKKEKEKNEKDKLVSEGKVLIPSSSAERRRDWEVVLLVDKREKDFLFFESFLTDENVISEVRPLVIGDYIWVARRKKRSSQFDAFQEGTGDDIVDLGYSSSDSSCSTSSVLSTPTKKIKKIRNETESYMAVLDCIVERKTSADLASSIIDGRYDEQKQRLLSCGVKKVVYLYEGNTLSPGSASWNNSKSGGNGSRMSSSTILSALVSTQTNGAGIGLCSGMNEKLNEELDCLDDEPAVMHLLQSRNMDHTASYLKVLHG